MISTKRPKISIYIAISIDGHIAQKDDCLDFLDCVNTPNEHYGFHQFFDNIDALVLGRKTYDVAASVATWPYKGKKVVVLSNKLKEVKEEAYLYQGDLDKLISQLHLDGIKHIWVDGGVTISQFLKMQVVDQMTLSVVPVILGSGTPLFSMIDKELSCSLISSQSYSTGLIQLKYDIINPN